MSEKGTTGTETKPTTEENQQGMSGFMSSVFGSSSNNKNNDQQSANDETSIDFGEIQGFVNESTAGNNSASGKMSLTVASPAVRYSYFLCCYLDINCPYFVFLLGSFILLVLSFPLL